MLVVESPVAGHDCVGMANENQLNDYEIVHLTQSFTVG